MSLECYPGLPYVRAFPSGTHPIFPALLLLDKRLLRAVMPLGRLRKLNRRTRRLNGAPVQRIMAGVDLTFAECSVMSTSILFFATKRDLESLLAAIEVMKPLRYTRTGLFPCREVSSANSFAEIPNLGAITSEDYIAGDSYLVTPASAQVAIREVTQDRGGKLFAVDQQANPHSVAFWPGGEFQSFAILAGQVGTLGEDPMSKEIVSLFAREIRQRFERIKSSFVGAEATRLLDAGYRLTTSVKRPKGYDLSRN